MPVFYTSMYGFGGCQLILIATDITYLLTDLVPSIFNCVVYDTKYYPKFIYGYPASPNFVLWCKRPVKYTYF
jgi:uncharacterized membrane protein